MSDIIKSNISAWNAGHCAYKSIRLIMATSILISTGIARADNCPTGVDPTASTALSEPSKTQGCEPKHSHGYTLPDASCTPGAVNPTVTIEVLKGGKFKTSCERDTATSAAAKKKTYTAYNIKKPTANTGQNQTCELDHLISLELGGADTLDNIWPQCGPSDAELAKRYFKIKDRVENYLAARVKTGDISLEDAQQGIATDWTQYITQSTKYFKTHSIKGFGLDR